MPSPATHLRAPLLWLLVPFMAGLTAAKLWPPPAFGLGPLALTAGLTALAAGGLAFRDGPIARGLWAIGILVSAGLAGFALLHARVPALHLEESRPPREVTVTLRVLQVYPAATRSLTGLGVITATGEQDSELLGRRVYFSAIRRISVPPQRSGHYVIRGVIEPLSRETGDGGFNDYLANLGVRQKLTRAHLMSEVSPPGWFQRFCTRAQARLETILRNGLADRPQAASLYLAMLLGEKAQIPAEQENAFMRSGTFHIFSISGLHVGVIAGAIYITCGLLRLPRRTTLVAALIVLWFYVQITGARIPSLRAFQMIAFVSSVQIFRLPGNPLAALAASALLTLLIDPLQLFSTGFQMSYSVVVALVVMGRPLSDQWGAAWRPFALLPRGNWHWYHRWIEASGRQVLLLLAGCWTAFLASMPSSIGFFQVFSPGALPANLLVIPLASLTIWAGFVSLLAGLMGLVPVSALSNTVAATAIALMDWLLRHGTAVPGVWFNARFRADWLAPASLALLTAVLLAGSAGRWAPRYGGYWLPVGTLALIIILGVKFGG
jgi:competence protein ComEC